MGETMESFMENQTFDDRILRKLAYSHRAGCVGCTMAIMKNVLSVSDLLDHDPKGGDAQKKHRCSKGFFYDAFYGEMSLNEDHFKRIEAPTAKGRTQEILP
ncbi:hypothetical protein SOVF_131660 [Spinacia oleracea]|nr:hypothetical protein SOVF_131660 [Spinacia oleracea]